MSVKIKKNHSVSDPVYSNSYGLGYIHEIWEPEGSWTDTWYFVRWFDDELPPHAVGRMKYNSNGIDTLKMFLRMKMRGENV
jgi:hypothetical protein